MRPPSAPLRLAVLASGRGSNLQAILDAIAADRLHAEVVGVFSNRPKAPALTKVSPAQRWSADPRDAPDRITFDAMLSAAISAAAPDWVVCAGYMNILSEAFIERFPHRILNIHPSLLPKYRGLHTHARALAAGDTEHGASVHLVVPELDAGTVLTQAVVPVFDSDTPETLAKRVLVREHLLLVATLELLANGRLTINGSTPELDTQYLFTPLRLDSQGYLIR
ncbi:MAG TPA: phosphoribosylglycinamide formyltransferase [Xylella sp.]